MVTALAALEAGVVNAETKVSCPGYIEFGETPVPLLETRGPWHGQPGAEPDRKLRRLYYDIAQKVGIDKIAEMGRKLGLGQRFEIPMSAVTEGIMPDKAGSFWSATSTDWRIGDTINASIGQGYVLTSPLQLAVMAARIATGRAVVPRLIRMVQRPGTAGSLDAPHSFR